MTGCARWPDRLAGVGYSALAIDLLSGQGGTRNLQ